MCYYISHHCHTCLVLVYFEPVCHNFCNFIWSVEPVVVDTHCESHCPANGVSHVLDQHVENQPVVNGEVTFSDILRDVEAIDNTTVMDWIMATHETATVSEGELAYSFTAVEEAINVAEAVPKEEIKAEEESTAEDWFAAVDDILRNEDVGDDMDLLEDDGSCAAVCDSLP
ncbi:hypothetical protein F5Y19DRAFT_474612 [Xylariaceae sp. FL1651]|nr:hypothetical protein F5Y19DRAFT_474612 [Xylariaceae sp. FL1651]